MDNHQIEQIGDKGGIYQINNSQRERPVINEQGQIFFYKMVAKSLGKLFSIYDGKTEYVLGQTLYQEAVECHNGGFYVYPTVNQVIFADIPYKKGGLYIAPRTILKCICWGKKIEYDNGKISFSFICPVQDLGLPMGYKSSKTAVREAVKRFEEKQKKLVGFKKQQAHALAAQPKQRAQSAIKR